LEIVTRRLDPALRQRIDAADVLQEAFMRARARWGNRLETVSPFLWLYSVVTDCLCDEWRRHNRVGLGGLSCSVPWPEGSSAQLAGSLTTPSEAMDRAEQVERVRRVLAGLAGEDQRVLEMRIVDGLTFQEIGEMLGVSLNRAAYLFSRAMRRFKDVWERLDREGRPPT
jgi:RNA polymerase sigma-70 factor (ECF subfamily)